MRAIWTGSISFGLINVTVKLYSGSEERGGIDLHMLHKKDNSAIRYAKICREEGIEIPFDEIVKGFEYQAGEYVVITDADLKKVDAQRTKTIEIDEFTQEDQLDVRYFEKPYYLEPDKNAAKPYALLREALNLSHRVAVARFVLRSRERLAVIKPVGRALILNQMRFPAELREPQQLNLPEAEATNSKEIDMALKLIDQLTGPFIPEDYRDTYTEALEEMIEAKIKGIQPKKATRASTGAPAKDLMAALKESLEREKNKAHKK